jgi:hypothetical protein
MKSVRRGHAVVFSCAIFDLRSLNLRNNHFIYQRSLTIRRLVLDFLEPLNIRVNSL